MLLLHPLTSPVATAATAATAAATVTTSTSIHPSIHPCRERGRGDIQVAQQGQVIKNILKGHHYLYRFMLFPPKSSGRPTDISEKEGRKCAAI